MALRCGRSDGLETFAHFRNWLSSKLITQRATIKCEEQVDHLHFRFITKSRGKLFFSTLSTFVHVLAASLGVFIGCSFKPFC